MSGLEAGERLVVTFASTADAMAMEEAGRRGEVPGRIVPVPSAVSAGCGLAWQAPASRARELLETVASRGLAHEAAYAVGPGGARRLEEPRPGAPGEAPGQAPPAAPAAPEGPGDDGALRVGVDIGSTAAKAAVMRGRRLVDTLVVPTGFNSADAAERVAEGLRARGHDVEGASVVATGYGRVSVPYAARTLTEITCHGLGAAWLFGPDGVVVDVGGQDTKVIRLAGGKVRKFVMNDKCAAGTGKFLEVMADRMGLTQERLARLARAGRPTRISSMCTVFAESEVVSLVGRGEPLENIANGVVESVVSRVAALAAQVPGSPCFLTGGLCDNAYVVERLSERLGQPVRTEPRARFAGAIGAALSA